MRDRELARAVRAVERTAADDPRRPARLKKLGALWRERALAGADAGELGRAIAFFRAARAGTGTALATAEYSLAVLVSDRYDLAGDPADLAAAADAAQRALAALPDGTADRYDYLAMLSVCLWERYDAEGSLADLGRAIALATEAAASVPAGAPLWPRLHSNLAMMLADQYERTGTADLDQIVRHATAAVRAVRPGDAEGPGFRSNLASALRLRFEAQFGGPGDPLPEETIDLRNLDEAIRVMREALAELGQTPGEVDPAMLFSNLGDLLMDKALMHELVDAGTEAAGAWSQALAAHESAVAATPPAAPDRSGRLNKLAVVQRALADRSGSPDGEAAARASFREACELGLDAAPEMALAAAVNWTAWEVGRRAWAQAVTADGYGLAAAQALHRSQRHRADRETWLRASRGLAADAAYAAARCGDPRGAVTRLERGRAILLADELDLVPAALSRLPDAGLVERYAQAARLVRELG